MLNRLSLKQTNLLLFVISSYTYKLLVRPVKPIQENFFDVIYGWLYV